MTDDIDSAIVDAAIAWSVRLEFNRADPGQAAAFERWRAETAWGQLFDHYQAHGTLAPQDVSKTA